MKTAEEIANLIYSSRKYHRNNAIEDIKSYGEQEAKSFANWLSNQVIAGRTMTKLWNDYQIELT